VPRAGTPRCPGAVTSISIDDATLAAESLIGIGSYAVVIRSPERDG